MINSFNTGRAKPPISNSDEILGRINKTKLNTKETSINSAALQDHIMMNYNLGSLDPFKKKPLAYKKPAYLAKNSKDKQLGEGRALTNAGMNIIRTDSASSSLNASNQISRVGKKNSSYSRSNYDSDFEEKKYPKKTNEVMKTKDMIDKLNSETYINIEKKREEYVNKLTLAQRRGLVARPPMPLSQQEWKGIETKGATRIETSDSCIICLEKFRFENQTILSCTHIFHTKCLESFEKYSKSKVCPLCRQKDYDKKEYLEGQKKFLIRCLVKIQCLVKGFIQRIKFYDYMKNNNIKPGNQKLKRNLIAHKLGRISKKHIDKMKEERAGVEKYMMRMATKTKSAELLIEEFLPNVEKIYNERRENLSNLKIKIEEKSGKRLDYEWQKVHEKAIERGDCECSICYNNFNTTKTTYLLSCSHIFHQACLDNFERFDMSLKSSCPLCRVPYEKRLIQFESKNKQ